MKKFIPIILIVVLGGVATYFYLSPPKSRIGRCIELQPGIVKQDLDSKFGQAMDNNPGWLSYQSDELASGPIMARADSAGKIVELRCSTGDHDSKSNWKID